jgi:hypothetical protein
VVATHFTNSVATNFTSSFIAHSTSSLFILQACSMFILQAYSLLILWAHSLLLPQGSFVVRLLCKPTFMLHFASRVFLFSFLCLLLWPPL